MSTFVPIKQHLREALLFCFNLKKSAAEGHQLLCKAYGERYQQQLMQLSRALKFKRPQYAKRHDKVIFQHDNAQPHVAKVVKEILEALNWDVLPHPLYLSDIAPSDYHLFRSIVHGLAEQHVTSY